MLNHNSFKAHIIFERATLIVDKERMMPFNKRKHYIKFIKKIGSPFIDDNYNENISSIDDQISNLEDDIKEQKESIRNITSTVDNIVIIYFEYIKTIVANLNNLEYCN